MIAVFALILACGSTPDAPAETPSAQPSAEAAPAEAKPRDMDIAALATATSGDDFFVLDVRTADEFATGHVPGAVNIPLQDLGARMSELDSHKDADFAVICASGGRSSRATDSLRSQGFAGATNVTGGTKAWIAAGHATE